MAPVEPSFKILARLVVALCPIVLIGQSNDPKDDSVGVQLTSPPPLETSPGEAIGLDVDSIQPSTTEGRRKGELAVAPIPIVNPTIGNGLGAIAMYARPLTKSDEKSPPSVFGGGFFYTDNGSWGGGVATKLYLKEDRFRITAGAGKARLKYDFYGVGGASAKGIFPIQLTHSAVAFVADGQVRLVERWFAGPRFQTSDTNITPGSGDSGIPAPQLNARTTALGLHVTRDSRDSMFYPKAGSTLDFMVRSYDDAFGSDFNYSTYNVSYSMYRGLGEKGVFAYRVSACGVGDSAPFFGLCLLASRGDLRGYETGRYRDRSLLSGQVEYRRSLPKRFGFVVFAGAGDVAPELSKLSLSTTKPSAGVGVRYTLAKRSHVNLRFDIAAGQDGTVWYVGLGEAF